MKNVTAILSLLLVFCQALFDELIDKVAVGSDRRPVAPGSASYRCYCGVVLCHFIIRQITSGGVLVLVTSAFSANAYPSAVYQESVSSESVHLQLSEEVIGAGETLWFQGILRGDQATSTVLYVELLNRQGAVWQGIYPIKKKVAKGSIYLPDTLTGGWYQIRAYTQWMRNWGVTSFWSAPLLVINPQDDAEGDDVTQSEDSIQPVVHDAASERELTITLSKARYQPRASVSAIVSLSGTSDAAQVAVSVRKVNPLSRYFPPSGSQAVQNQAPDTASFRYRREDESLTVSGQVTDANQPMRGQMVTLWVPGDNPRLAYSFVQQDGVFHVAVDERLAGTRQAVLQMSDTSFQTQWALDEKFAPENTYGSLAIPSVPTSAWQAIQQAYRRRTLINTQYGLIRAPDTAAVQDKADFRFYGAPNFTVYPDDYIALPAFDEIVREMLPGVQLRESKGGYYFKVFDISTRTFLSGEPSVLLDGMLVNDLSYIVGMSPSDIARIETVNRRTYYGEYRLDGAIAIYTKEGNAYLPVLPPSALPRSLQFYTPTRPFSAPDSLLVHEPDFRTLLYWQPGVTLSREPYTLTFNHADELGEFEVVVEGVTKDGEQIYGRATYSVSLTDIP